MDCESRIIEVTGENLLEHPQVICFINPKHEFYGEKIEWLQKRFKEGLRIKLLYLSGEKRPVGFVEYVPGEQCWRAVDAKGYLFIHCLWTNGKKHQHQGLGTRLIAEVERDAADYVGVAVMTSEKAFMANKDIFLKRGYSVTAESGTEQLLTRQFREAPLPSFKDWKSQLRKYKKPTLVFSRQCPWVARFMKEVPLVLSEYGLSFETTELKTAAMAQNAPSPYGVFSFVHDGKLLADRYVSTTRFRNILKKELKL